jgi:hypothetical protein
MVSPVEEHDVEFPAEAAPEGTGLYCFLDRQRECGPDCMAFLPEPSADKAQTLSLQQRSCTIIVSTERVGRFMGGLVQLGLQRQASADKRAQDEERRRSILNPLPPRSG